MICDRARMLQRFFLWQRFLVPEGWDNLRKGFRGEVVKCNGGYGRYIARGRCWERCWCEKFEFFGI